MLPFTRNIRNIKNQVHHKTVFACILVFLVFFIPRVVGLGWDMANYDSSYWYPRMDNFTKYLLRGEYGDTYQTYHPGVTLLWTSGTSKYIFEKVFEIVFHYNPRYIPHQFPKINFISILPLVFIISILGTVSYYLIKRLTNHKLAVIFAIMLSLEPFFLGISRFHHVSALTSMFMFTSCLSLFYSYHTSSKARWWYYLSAILLGLGVLTKIDAIIAGPINLLVILYYDSYKFKKSLKVTFMDVTFYGIAVFATFYSLFPSMWVSPWWTIRRIIHDGVENTAFESSGAATASGIRALYYPETILFRSLPTTTLAFIGGLFFWIRQLLNKRVSRNYKDFLTLAVIFVLFNIIILTIPDKIKDRYLTNLYPAIILISSAFIHTLISGKKILKWVVIGILTITYSITIYRYHPIYSFYYSDLIGGPAGIPRLGLNIKNRGEYYAQAAQYLNAKEGVPEELNVVLSHREQIRTFQPFFIGTSYTNPTFLPDKANVDYIIVRPDMEYLIPHDQCTLEKSFGPKNPFGYKILGLYKCEGITNQYKSFRN